jgi:hypothetical protein
MTYGTGATQTLASTGCLWTTCPLCEEHVRGVAALSAFRSPAEACANRALATTGFAQPQAALAGSV